MQRLGGIGGLKCEFAGVLYSGALGLQDLKL